MKSLFELSKEHYTIPSAEIFACLISENIYYNTITSNEDLLLTKIISFGMENWRVKYLISSQGYWTATNLMLFSCKMS